MKDFHRVPDQDRVRKTLMRVLLCRGHLDQPRPFCQVSVPVGVGAPPSCPLCPSCPRGQQTPSTLRSSILTLEGEPEGSDLLMKPLSGARLVWFYSGDSPEPIN